MIATWLKQRSVHVCLIALFVALLALQISPFDQMHAKSDGAMHMAPVHPQAGQSTLQDDLSEDDLSEDDLSEDSVVAMVTETPTSWPTSNPQSTPHNIIIMIGDGMGYSHVDAASMYKYGEAGAMAFEYAPHQAEMTTFAADNEVTDSAAAASAMATGHKTNNSVVALEIPGDGSELETSLEYYQDRCKATGLVTNSSITHATPASFAAHEAYRYSYSEIAADYFTQTRPNILFGGAENGITSEAAEAAGYQVIKNRNEMLAVDVPANPAAELFVSGQFGFGHFAYEFDQAIEATDFYDEMPHLSEMTKTALELLEGSPEGFFLVIEGARIDHAGHSNLIKHNVFETIEFEKTFIEVMRWMDGREDTLLLMTADHETGGLEIEENNGQWTFPQVSWGSNKHTAVNVPVYAWGPNAQMVANTIDNTDIYEISLAGNENDLPCIPGVTPTEMPTVTPTITPTVVLTSTPTLVPTETPTVVLTSTSTLVPTEMPTVILTSTPTLVPTETPMIVLTSTPTLVPTEMPTVVLTSAPTFVPTETPMIVLTSTPTLVPTEVPTVVLTSTPTLVPTEMPTVVLTSTPTFVPTEMPTVVLTTTPAVIATESPTVVNMPDTPSTPAAIDTPVPASTSGSLVAPLLETNTITIAVKLVDESPSISWFFTGDGNTQWFNVYRTQGVIFEQTEEVAASIPAQNSGTNNYKLKDRQETTSAVYYYWLEQILFDGQSILHGPQTLIMGQGEGRDSIYLPLIDTQ